MPPLAFAAVFAFYRTYLPRGKRGTVFAIESANIVGYQNVPVAAGYSCFTATFKSVSGSAIDLTDIMPATTDGVALSGAAGRGKIQVMKLDLEGNVSDSYAYYTNKTPVGWYKNGTENVDKGTITFANGEGMIVLNNIATGATFQVSGEVDLVCKNLIPGGYSIFGNSTPVQIGLSEIIPLTVEGEQLSGAAGRGKIQVMKLDTEGNVSESYAYYTNKTPAGWYKNGTEAVTSENDLLFKAGESFYVLNNLSGALLSLPSPIK